MIKRITMTCLLIVSASQAQAQNDWYFSADVGVHAPDTSARLHKGSSSTIDSSFYNGSPTFEYDDSKTVLGIAVGKKLSPNLQAELELRQRKSSANNNVLRGSGVRAADTFQLDSSVKSSSLMLNGIVPVTSYGTITPYLKAGIGVTRHQTEAALTASINAFGIPAGAPNRYPQKTENTFTWALGAGASWALSPTTSVDMEYQYIDMGEASTAKDTFSDTVQVDTKSHELTVGLSYLF